MSKVFRTPLTALQKSASKWPSSAALKIPHWTGDGVFDGWETITFAQFLHDVENAGRYWANELSQRGLQERDIVGIWVKGLSYQDGVHIWGIARAGYIPQLISLRLTHLEVVYDVLKRAKARAVTFDPMFLAKLDVDMVALPVVDTRSMSLDHLPLPQLWIPSSETDIVAIYHSSGSTSGSPKIVPWTAKWADYAIESVVHIFGTNDIRHVVASNGSFCHVAAAMCLMGCNEFGHCVILSKDIPSSPTEVKMMINEYGLTILFMFSSFLAQTIREARSDPELLQALLKPHSVLHGGLAMNPDEAAWARCQKINLVDAFASSEVGMMMMGVGGFGSDAGYLRPPPDVRYKFVPVPGSSAVETGAENQPSKDHLLELIVLADSRNCPHPSLLDKETGNFHTGDLFVEPIPGYYVSRGRNDDWIKMEISLRCDTKSIETNLMETCGKDLVSTAVCVGSGRPSPALLVEPIQSVEDEIKLKEEIFSRIKSFHERRYVHERIDDPRFIILVQRGSLPRTSKGGVPRKLVEESKERMLDELFSNARS